MHSTRATAAEVSAAAFILQATFEQGRDLDYAEIERRVDDLTRRFDAAGLIAVARAFDICSGLTSKTAAKERILNKICERKARYERGAVISAIARGTE